MRNIYLKSQSILHYLESYSESAVYIANNKWLNRSNFAYGVCAAAGELFDASRSCESSAARRAAAQRAFLRSDSLS